LKIDAGYPEDLNSVKVIALSFPDYKKLISEANSDKLLDAVKKILKDALLRPYISNL
jgi:hypothetical protein